MAWHLPSHLSLTSSANSLLHMPSKLDSVLAYHVLWVGASNFQQKFVCTEHQLPLGTEGAAIATDSREEIQEKEFSAPQHPFVDPGIVNIFNSLIHYNIPC